MKVISLIKPENVYLPEAEAYKSYFSRHGFLCEIQSPDAFTEPDILWRFMGTDPFFRFRPKRSFNIHEYGSLSIPPFPKTKDYIKRIINAKPDARVFLNNDIEKKYRFNGSARTFYRPMGVEEAFIKEGKRHHQPEFDLIYCGSITKSRDIDKALYNLSKSSLTILLIGTPEAEIYKNFKNFKNIHFAGRIGRKDLPKAITLGKYGLNITPNIYPYSFQDSTKVIEYCALGLPVISTKHDWSSNFAQKNNATFHYIDNEYEDLQHLTAERLQKIDFAIPNMESYSWSSIIDRSQILDWLKTL